MTRFETLRSNSVDVVLDMRGGVPAIAYWGDPLGDRILESDLELLADEVQVPGILDVSRRVEVVPVHADGFPGRPGIQGHRRGGRQWAPRFTHITSERVDGEDCSILVCRSRDSTADLVLEIRFALDSHGVLVLSACVENTGVSSYMLDALTVSIAMPGHADELGTFTGRWAREFHLERFPWRHGAWTAENRSGRTSHDHPPFAWVLENRTSEFEGEVWGVHASWSGNHVIYADHLSDGRKYVQIGELFHPGEVAIEPAGKVSTPEIVCVHSSRGINAASHAFHGHVRRHSPVRIEPRRVHLNTWEAVYFDHDVERLKSLAETAASVGVERFVLDDGWFGSRRNDSSGLGDWVVAAKVYPEGLEPLISHVLSLGMDFGIWVEPEMANPDSDVLRAHPEWVLSEAGYEPVLGRNQVVLDLTRSDAFDHVFGQLDDLLRNNAISYVKWDMNRPLVQASSSDGKAASRHQVFAVYRLLDRLRERHPHVEFESCASGGGRIDFEMLKRVERVWTSDNNDALERHAIVRGASMMLPLHVLGTHIGPSPSHTTRRRHSIAFRGAAALFGHMGIEADLTTFDEPERADVARIVAVYKEHRELLHSGDFVRFDPICAGSDADTVTALAHGVIAHDGSQALISLNQIATETSLVPDRLRIRGLRSDLRYTATFVPLSAGQVSGMRLGPANVQPNWLRSSVEGRPETISGQALSAIGLPRPVLWPETSIVVHLSCA